MGDISEKIDEAIRKKYAGKMVHISGLEMPKLKAAKLIIGVTISAAALIGLLFAGGEKAVSALGKDSMEKISQKKVDSVAVILRDEAEKGVVSLGEKMDERFDNFIEIMSASNPRFKEAAEEKRIKDEQNKKISETIKGKK